jgi:hypothetical protein
MANLSALKKRLDDVASETGNRDNQWKPPVGKSVIRFIPYKFDDDMPFRQLKFHYGLGKSVFCLTNEDKPCPICEAAKQAWKDAKTDPESKKLAIKLSAKTRYYTPVLVRSEKETEINESKVWAFGKTVYKEILQQYDDTELDLTKKEAAPDFTVIRFDKSKEQPFGSTELRLNPKTISKPLPISVSNEETEKFIDSIPEIESLFIKNTAEEAIVILETYMKGLDDSTSEEKDQDIIAKMKGEAPEAEKKTKTAEPETDLGLDEEIDALLNSDDE